MKFERFATLKDMTQYAIVHATKTEGKVWVEASTYMEDVWARPSVFLICEGEETVCLRWNAYHDEQDIDFMGPRARREAMEKAEHMVEIIQSAITRSYTTSMVTEATAMAFIKHNNVECFMTPEGVTAKGWLASTPRAKTWEEVKATDYDDIYMEELQAFPITNGMVDIKPIKQWLGY